MKTVCKLLLKILGWTVVSRMPEGVNKSVIVAAPHTSNWDFIIGRLAYGAMGIPVKFLIKKESFFWPFGYFLKKMGGIPVDRKKNNRMVENISKQFEANDVCHLIVTPEGTRSLVKNWKKGFYYIAEASKAPIILGYIDYKEKIGGLGPILNANEMEYKDVLDVAKDFYKDKNAKYPEKFNFGPHYQK